MAADKTLRLVIVTPERTLFDETVSSLRFPLYDGAIGILPGRLPLIGRLGAGELKVHVGGQERSFFVDGGFVQVKQGVVTLLTNQAQPTDELTAAVAEQDLTAALARPAHSDDEYRAKAAAQTRARRMRALARR
jgi:F-type H+-transporting ATPase subunit epsilon